MRPNQYCHEWSRRERLSTRENVSRGSTIIISVMVNASQDASKPERSWCEQSIEKKKAKQWTRWERYRGAFRKCMAMEDLIGRRKTELKQNLFMFDRDSSIVPILGNYDLPKTLQARWHQQNNIQLFADYQNGNCLFRFWSTVMRHDPITLLASSPNQRNPDTSSQALMI